MRTRQAVPYTPNRKISELGLPSLQSEVKKEVFVQMPGCGLGAGGDMGGLDVGCGRMGRTPPQSAQSAQSVPYVHIGNTELGLPFGAATHEDTCTCDGCAQARGTCLSWCTGVGAGAGCECGRK